MILFSTSLLPFKCIFIPMHSLLFPSRVRESAICCLKNQPCHPLPWFHLPTSSIRAQLLSSIPFVSRMQLLPYGHCHLAHNCTWLMSPTNKNSNSQYPKSWPNYCPSGNFPSSSKCNLVTDNLGVLEASRQIGRVGWITNFETNQQGWTSRFGWTSAPLVLLPIHYLNSQFPILIIVFASCSS